MWISPMIPSVPWLHGLGFPALRLLWRQGCRLLAWRLPPRPPLHREDERGRLTRVGRNRGKIFEPPLLGNLWLASSSLAGLFTRKVRSVHSEGFVFGGSKIECSKAGLLKASFRHRSFCITRNHCGLVPHTLGGQQSDSKPWATHASQRMPQADSQMTWPGPRNFHVHLYHPWISGFSVSSVKFDAESFTHLLPRA